MSQHELKVFIEGIIGKTFTRLKEVYDEHKENNINKNTPWEKTESGSRLVFPQYGEHREKELRVSEQELRFAFVEVFNEECNKDKGLNLFYSIETPTEDRYSGFSNGGEPKPDEQGRSAEFDLVIFNEEGKRVCLIEFKAQNPGKPCYDKDFVKLENDNEGGKDVLRYFLQIVESSNNGTFKSISDKLGKRGKTEYRCYDLNKNGEEGEDITNKILNPKNNEL